MTRLPTPRGFSAEPDPPAGAGDVASGAIVATAASGVAARPVPGRADPAAAVLGSLGPDGVEVRGARDGEARACRLLLPEMFDVGQAPDLLVATAAEPGRGAPLLVGAAGLGTVFGPGTDAFPVWLHVVPAHRRRGVGRYLIEAARARARGRAPCLRALRPVPADGQASAFLAACGFEGFDRILTFETDTLAFHAMMAALRARLERGARVPATARVVRLREAPPAGIADLVARHFPATRAQVLAKLSAREAEGGYDPANSVAVLLGGTLVGALLFGWLGGVPMIEARVVEPGLRGGWANVLLLEAATRNGMEAGSRRFRFFCDERVADTLALARRAGADLVRVEHHYWTRRV